MLTLHISSGRAAGQLELPAPLDDLKRQLEMIRAESQTNDIPTVQNIDCPVPSLGWHLQHTRLDSDFTLQRLNQLAEVIDGMNTAGHCHLSKSLSREFRQGLEDVLQIAVHIKPDSIDRYEVIPGVSTHKELGKWLVEHDHLEARAPEILRPYLDYRSIDTYEERTRTVKVKNEAGVEVEKKEKYTVAVPITDLNTVYQNIASAMAVTISDEQKANADSVYNLVRYGASTGAGLGSTDAPFIGADGLCSPVGSNWRNIVTSEFGYRKDPFTGKSKGHGGIDLGIPTGTSVRAALPGTVTVAQYSSSYGYYVMIDHGGGLATLYAHNSKLLVKVGQIVNAGDIVSLSGSTGRSTGPHLHFEVRVNGERTNPRSYLP